MNRFRTFAAVIALLFVFALTACGRDDAQREGARTDAPVADRDDQRPSTPNADVDQTQAPGGDDEPSSPEGARAVRTTLYANQVRTRHVIDGAVTAGKIGFVAATVNVNAAATSGSSGADPTLVNGILIGCHPAGNQDQHVDNVVLTAGTGAITVTLAAAATAQNNFRCLAWKANAQGR